MRRLLGMWGGLVVLVLQCQFALGQQAPAPANSYLNGRTFILVANGPNDFNSLSENLQRVFENNPNPNATPIIRAINWTRTDATGMQDYSSRNAHLMGAAMMAYDANKLRQAYPNSPIYLMGYGAGSCVALSAAEQLPPASVERIVLLSPAVSSHYDVRYALKASRQGMDVFYHTEDSILEFTESEIGTADGTRDTIAGRTGFLINRGRYNAAAVDPILINLRQHDISNMNGGHLAAARTSFLQSRVAPLIATGQRLAVPTSPPPPADSGMRLPPVLSAPPALPPMLPPTLPTPPTTRTPTPAPPLATPALPTPSTTRTVTPTAPAQRTPSTTRTQTLPPPAPPALPAPAVSGRAATAPATQQPITRSPSIGAQHSPLVPMLPPPAPPKSNTPPLLPPPTI